MPFRKTNRFQKRRPKRNYKRKSYRKRRFANNTTVSKFNATLNPRTLYVKVPWVYSSSLPLGSFFGSIPIGGNFCFTPLVNLSFVTTEPNILRNLDNAPVPMGLARYGPFYRSYRVLGAALTVEFNNDTDLSSLTCAVTAFQGRVNTLGTTDPLDNYSRLVGADNDSFKAWPNTRYTRMGTVDSGKSVRKLKMYIKSKSILGLKDMRDAESCSLPINTGSNTIVQANQPVPPIRDSWSFMLRIMSDTENTDEISIPYTVRIKYFVELTDRQYVNMVRYAEPEP